MKIDAEHFILQVTAAEALFKMEEVQSLWSGYGAIKRYGLSGTDREQVIVKQVTLPQSVTHPRGWNTSLSHQRKIHSYGVECAWYQHYAHLCDDACPVAECLGLDARDDEFLIVLEDLDAGGFPLRKESVTLAEMQVCLSWLANFHATFMGRSPDGLWPIGTYWHLATRPDELAALDDQALKAAAGRIDQQLKDCPYQTFVHGDAKLANFCFSVDGLRVAAVDFQYVGGGCGMKDVAYFIGSCLGEEDCERYEQLLLDAYFDALNAALISHRAAVEPQAVEQCWRALYPVAWTDFHRFLKGWSPGHWKIHDYSERLARQVLGEY